MNFAAAIEHVKKWEGGWVNDPNDPGGATNFGISLRMALADDEVNVDMDGDGDEDEVDMKLLTWEVAQEIYRKKYWKYGAVENEKIATKLLDMGVNMGPGRSHRICQQALNSCGGWNIKVDGAWGPATERAVNSTDPKLLLTMMTERHLDFYRNLVAEKPALKKFLKGWERRAQSILPCVPEGPGVRNVT
jgi:lysozyme family protein